MNKSCCLSGAWNHFALGYDLITQLIPIQTDFSNIQSIRDQRFLVAPWYAGESKAESPRND